ncbi:rad51 domain-containing protein [Sarocladium implicatum]|nr:rad51 domain-containing protein [Sarocladium implicatum]
MDHYHTVHEPDIVNFGTSETHRLPTVSATQALDDVCDDGHTHLSTGLKSLDYALLGPNASTNGDADVGGVKRGQITEFWGPPGCGKSEMGAQVSAAALCAGSGVLWVDCFRPVPTRKVLEAIEAQHGSPKGDVSTTDGTEAKALGRFVHYRCLTLPHLLALILRPSSAAIPADISVVVLDSLTALVNAALPKPVGGRAKDKAFKGPTPSTKRRQGLQAIMTALQKLAGARNCAVVLLSQCATRMHTGGGATLTPAINATVWEQGLSTRVALFRDWIWTRNEPAGVFLAGIQKVDGRSSVDAVDHVSAFQIGTGQLVPIQLDSNEASTRLAGVTQQKRKLGQTGFEVPDSEDDEDYGWGDEDEAALPAPPPQWQGSEDILLGQDIGRSEDEEEEGENGLGFDDRVSEQSEPVSP